MRGSVRVTRGAAAVAAVAVMLIATAIPAGAALTTPACLAKKLKEWGKLRKCQAIETGKALQGRTADPAKCQARFDDRVAKLNALAAAAAVPCRYAVNSDGTATDCDTGLQWERKTTDGSVHDRSNQYTWSASGGPPDGTAFTVYLASLNNALSPDGTFTTGCFAGHCDWRLPAIEELTGIVDISVAGCGSGTPCIDQTVFGPAMSSYVMSASTDSGGVSFEWIVFFWDGTLDEGPKTNPYLVRAVRSAL